MTLTAQPPRVSIINDPQTAGAPVLDFYLKHWRERSNGGRRLPPRATLNPRELKKYLPAMALLEALPGQNDFRFRLVGTAVTRRLLPLATGRTIREVYAAAEKSYVDGVVRLHASVCERKTPLLLHASGGDWLGLHYPAFDVLYLPLAGEKSDEASFVLSAYAFPSTLDADANCGFSLRGRKTPLPLPFTLPANHSP